MSYEDPPTTLNIAYLGPEASFSHQAAIEVFTTPSTSSSPVTLHPLPSFSSIFSAIQQCSSPNPGDADPPHTSYDYAVIPIENSTNGSVVQVLDLLAQCGLDPDALYPDIEVCAEYYLSVHHCLFVSPSPALTSTSTNTSTTSATTLTNAKSSIRTLYTHPQVWGQCTRFLSTHFPPTHVERIDVGSTSAAAQLVVRESETKGLTVAAIGSKLAGQRHNLVCLAENIEDEPGSNTTRFFVVRNSRTRKPNEDLIRVSFSFSQQSQSANTPFKTAKHKSLITFTISHTKPGALADALAVFKTYSFNLTSIDTRPSRKRNWQYVFFVECEEAEAEADDMAGNSEAGGPEVGDNLKNMLTHLEKFTESLRYLGRFKDQLQR
ncbi:prephenate dehydratase [Exophiala xenobiotica]|nr:prephenate dehydratase [Exophiala xenobiotica]